MVFVLQKAQDSKPIDFNMKFTLVAAVAVFLCAVVCFIYFVELHTITPKSMFIFWRKLILFSSQVVYAEPSSDGVDLRKSMKCFGDVCDELIGKTNRHYKHRLYITNVSKILDRCMHITVLDWHKRWAYRRINVKLFFCVHVFSWWFFFSFHYLLTDAFQMLNLCSLFLEKFWRTDWSR